MAGLEITRQNEKEIDRRIEQDLQGYRMAPNGRNLLAFRMRWLDNPNYRERFDDTFKGAPATKEWWDDQFCSKCDKRKEFCICGKEEVKPGEVRFMAPRGVIRG